VAFVAIVQFVLQVLFASALDRTLVVGIKTHAHTCFATDTAAHFTVAACANCAAVREEEVEELIWDGEM
jgi:hypothetical protein